MNKHVFLGLVIVIYTVAAIATFESLYNSIQLSSVALVGLCGWFYGIRVGLFSTLFFILLNTGILFVVSGQPYDVMLTYDPLGIILAMICALITGSMREIQDELYELKGTLTSRVEEATYKLNELAQQLIENDEEDRIRIGQDLHDGAGQYLTSMLLHSEALTQRLAKNQEIEADQAARITDLVQKNILLVRDFARSLLPNYLDESGLHSAMEAMVDFFREANPTIPLNLHNKSENLSREKDLHLYRITQESIFRLLKNRQLQRIDIGIWEDEYEISLIITGQGCWIDSISEDLFASNILKYRVRAINGTLVFENPEPGICRLQCTAKAGEAV